MQAVRTQFHPDILPILEEQLRMFPAMREKIGRRKERRIPEPVVFGRKEGQVTTPR
jgi:hypothetical protein